jgi:hypothetical protein
VNDRGDDGQGSRGDRVDDSIRDLSNAAEQLLGAIVDLLDDLRRALQGKRPE